MLNDPALSANQTRELSAFAGTMIPASAHYGVPGADDAQIFADILKSLGRDRDDVGRALDAAGRAGGRLLRRSRRPSTASTSPTTFVPKAAPALAAITRVVLLCYYRDDRVMHSLGQEPRPPFPKGHIVEQGDWSLLDPVKARRPFYRRVT